MARGHCLAPAAHVVWTRFRQRPAICACEPTSVVILAGVVTCIVIAVAAPSAFGVVVTFRIALPENTHDVVTKQFSHFLLRIRQDVSQHTLPQSVRRAARRFAKKS